MADSWKLTAFAPKPLVEAALDTHGGALDWDPEIVVSGFEIADDKPDDWRLDAYIPRKPNAQDRKTVAALFKGDPPKIISEKLPDTDWVTESQKGVEPIRAGNFFVHTPDFPPSDEASVRSFCIPASQAFGTGQHATTAGCLAMLTEMKRRGVVARDIADIGTGTGLLAFAAMYLWPSARATASDIDPVCLEVILRNMESNGITPGAGVGEMTPVIAPGMDDPLLRSRAPYDLLIANILAAPLVELAPDFSDATAPGGSILLAGLLETQEAAVRRAYRKAGFRLAARLVNGDWSILWLRKRNLR
ncbi:50S ribosomal protein L11 methyltransferase [Altererythrobacter sp. MF3-039]|uniref:50S ribosomal protein L11 methyltransferase n=1 Tax=Altererythrobacter sp. MF3-039 TaxID=3252901 RepID=UPI00390C6D50